MPRCSPSLNGHLHELRNVTPLVAGSSCLPQTGTAGRAGLGDGGRPLDLMPAQSDHRNTEFTSGLERLIRHLVLKAIAPARERGSP
ncbi:hypothetical protein HUW46_02081 [Amycolatopsis sp. CA-230715]|nr:hypothetical protein HUW46_02081 [Amycolatopsis sp. CA-230715]